MFDALLIARLRRCDTKYEALCAAARSLQARGWVQHRLGTADGPRCALGALIDGYRYAMQGQPGKKEDEATFDIGDLERIIESVLPPDAGGASGGIVGWNDEPGRSYGDIMRAFVTAISTLGPLPADLAGAASYDVVPA